MADENDSTDESGGREPSWAVLARLDENADRAFRDAFPGDAVRGANAANAVRRTIDHRGAHLFDQTREDAAEDAHSRVMNGEPFGQAVLAAVAAGEADQLPEIAYSHAPLAEMRAKRDAFRRARNKVEAERITHEIRAAAKILSEFKEATPTAVEAQIVAPDRGRFGNGNDDG